MAYHQEIIWFCMVTIDEIIDQIREYNPRVDAARIRQGFEYSKQHLRGMYRLSGESKLVHALVVTENLLAFKPDDNSVLAALMHDVSKAQSFKPDDIRNSFGEDVALLIEGMEKLQAVHLKGGKPDFEAFRRMLLSLAQDLRLVLICLVDLAQDLESLDYIPQTHRKDIAKEVLEIYAPIASRLGIYSIKYKLEDIAFKYLYPEQYNDLSSQLEKHVRRQEKFLEKVKKQLSDFLQEQGIQARVEGRLKNLYSIFRKLKKKGKTSLDEVYDIFAFRIILPTNHDDNGAENTEKLYTLLGLIHSHWTFLPDRFKDYVAVPKPNGYCSLHTTLIGVGEKNFDQPFEVQIRSEAMHEQSEFGFASHWLYEDTHEHSGELREAKYKRYQQWLDGLVSLQLELAEGKDFGNNVKLNLFQDHIFVFTPDGAVKDLPQGSTPVDFAYAVHTDIGHKCHGAKVNGSIVPLDYKLKSGERVEILTVAKSEPKPHWLSFVQSSQAKNKIKSYLKSLDTDQSYKEGKELVNKYLASIGEGGLDDNLSILRNSGQHKLSLKERESLLENIGNGAVNVATVLKKNFGGSHLDHGIPKKHHSEAVSKKGNNGILDLKKNEIFIAGAEKVPYKLSSCCKPKFGDAIVGYVTRGNAVRIHLQSCKFLSNGDPKRTLEASWGYQIHKQKLMPITIDLKAIDRVGLIRDIASTIAGFNVNIVDFTLKERRDNFIHRHMVLEVTNDEQYQKILKKLRQVRNVLEVTSLDTTAIQ